VGGNSHLFLPSEPDRQTDTQKGKETMKKRIRTAVLLTTLAGMIFLAGCAGEYPARLTPEEAQEIVLNHAGVTAEEVKRLRTGFEYDDRVPQYEVKFRKGFVEYEYEVHGDTGEILSVDVDD